MLRPKRFAVKCCNTSRQKQKEKQTRLNSTVTCTRRQVAAFHAMTSRRERIARQGWATVTIFFFFVARSLASEIVPRARLSSFSPNSRVVKPRSAWMCNLYGELVLPFRRRHVYKLSRLLFFALQRRLGGGPFRNAEGLISAAAGLAAWVVNIVRSHTPTNA